MNESPVRAYRFGPFCLDPSRRTLTRDALPVPIAGKTFDVLLALLERHGQVVDKQELLRVVWPGAMVEEANLSQQVFTLRKLLGEAADRHSYIATAPKRGYGFFGDVQIDASQPVAWAAGRFDDRARKAGVSVVRLTMPLPQGAPLALLSTSAIAISPDGRRIAYVAAIEKTTRLFLRELDNFEARPLAGTDGAVNPFFSPDGLWIGFAAGQRLQRLAIGGGPPMTISEIDGDIRGATWGGDDQIVFAPGPATGLWRVSAAGGAPQALTTIRYDTGERTHRWPHALPNGRGVIFTIGTEGTASFDEASLAVTESGGEHRVVLYHGSDGRYVPSGHLIYSRRGALLKTPFDLDNRQVRGSGRPALSGVASAATGAGHFALSTTGVLVYATGEVQTVRRTLLTVAADGTRSAPIVSGEGLEEPRLSPDKRRVILGLRGRHTNLWLYDFLQAPLMRLTFEGDNFAAIWGPDAETITFSSNRAGACDLFCLRPDSGAAPDLLVGSEFDKVPGSWSPDERTLAYTEYHPETGADIWLLDHGTGESRPWLRSRSNEYAPAFSRDGRYLAFTSDETGRPEVHVAAFPGGAGRRRLSTDGGGEALWLPGGRTLAYRNGDRLMVVDVGENPEHAGVPRTLFEGRYVSGALTGLANYEPGVEPGSFLMVSEDEPPRPESLSVVVNWFAELASRA